MISPKTNIEDEETNINMLLSIALEKVVLMPYAYLLDRWRWDLYQGKVPASKMNCHWHALRQDIQGKLKTNPASI